MNLDHILLGLLQTPATGYDLKRLFDEGIGHFWAAEFSQIYTTLKRLEASGDLRSWKEPSSKGPPRRVYEITPQGHDTLAKWLRSSPVVADERHSYLAQLYLMSALGDLSESLRFMGALRDHFAAGLARMQEQERQWIEADPRYPDALPIEHLHVQMVLRLGLIGGEARVRWCEECIERLRARIAADE
ncbi:MAG: PadR family transcriptional regulator [Armatimonadetes bacterium]|jgi:DNA-binding PadR family transcriptional regulator|nr:PadR family transcriptional regulator [Armatimonadota bacterium]